MASLEYAQPLTSKSRDDAEPLHTEHPDEWRRFSLLLSTFLLIIIVLFGVCVEYGDASEGKDMDIQYLFYLNVTVMMLVGFGFLMTFMRKFQLGAVGLTFLITAMCIPWCILTGRFFASITDKTDSKYPGLIEGHRWGKVHLDINALLNGNFAAAAVLISFGALIGKLTPSQTVLLAILEVPIYSFNKEVLAIWGTGTLDMGGTVFIHLFGAYFGLSAAYMIGAPEEEDAEKAEPTATSDILSLIGTAFLWIYWPSFNGATAPLGESQQLYTTTNTVLSLCASCIVTFAVSAMLNHKISTVDVQNATLAGGVAIGASSNLMIQPWVALLTGACAGAASTLGFNRLQPVLESKLGLHDSCGVHNLHGIPAIIGSIVVTIAVSVDSSKGDAFYDKGNSQSQAQLEGAGLTLITALVCGAAVGWFVKTALPGRARFSDADFWTVAGSFGKED